MAKKIEVPSFDDLKNGNHVYHYSRAERLARRRQSPLDIPAAPKRKGKLNILTRFFGGNKTVKNFVVFYVIIAAGIWGIYFMGNRRTSVSIRQTVNPGQVVEARWVNQKERTGFSISLNNTGSKPWVISNIGILSGKQTILTNYTNTVAPGEFDAMFLTVEGGFRPEKKWRALINHDLK